MNLIQQKLTENKKLLSIYFTAGFPKLEDTKRILEELEASAVDMVEIGLPFSDPLADGPTIQYSSQVALDNGMTTEKLFEQLENIREIISMPLLIMGYFNPILQYGVESFCRKCHQVGINGLIIPDLPLEEYEQHYREVFEQYDILPVFLISPQTSEKRIRQIDALSKGFIYMVSSSGVTGGTSGFGAEQQKYFRRIYDMKLETPLIVGFGIKDAQSFSQATEFSSGAIIGSAFIKQLESTPDSNISSFINSIT